MKLFLARFQAFSDDFFDGALQFQPRVSRGWVGGRREGVGGVGREEAKAPQVKTRGPELLTDSPDHTTRQPGRRDIILVKGRIPGR